ncbi:type II toxin-antitoxin system RelE/ParE family toxin [Salegentibacter sp. HM20]
MGSYRLSELARIDLIRIHHYGVLNFGEQQADDYFNAIFDQFDKIATNPFMFQKIDYLHQDYRRCVFGVDSIYYRIEEGVVEIIRIIGRQDFRL